MNFRRVSQKRCFFFARFLRALLIIPIGLQLMLPPCALAMRQMPPTESGLEEEIVSSVKNSGGNQRLSRREILGTGIGGAAGAAISAVFGEGFARWGVFSQMKPWLLIQPVGTMPVVESIPLLFVSPASSAYDPIKIEASQEGLVTISWDARKYRSIMSQRLYTSVNAMLFSHSIETLRLENPIPTRNYNEYQIEVVSMEGDVSFAHKITFQALLEHPSKKFSGAIQRIPMLETDFQDLKEFKPGTVISGQLDTYYHPSRNEYVTEFDVHLRGLPKTNGSVTLKISAVRTTELEDAHQRVQALGDQAGANGRWPAGVLGLLGFGAFGYWIGKEADKKTGMEEGQKPLHVELDLGRGRFPTTYLNRYPVQMHILREIVIPRLIESKRSGIAPHRLVLFEAGTSTGEALATIAATALDALDDLIPAAERSGWQLEVVGIEHWDSVFREAQRRLAGEAPLVYWLDEGGGRASAEKIVATLNRRRSQLPQIIRLVHGDVNHAGANLAQQADVVFINNLPEEPDDYVLWQIQAGHAWFFAAGSDHPLPETGHRIYEIGRNFIGQPFDDVQPIPQLKQMQTESLRRAASEALEPESLEFVKYLIETNHITNTLKQGRRLSIHDIVLLRKAETSPLVSDDLRQQISGLLNEVPHDLLVLADAAVTRQRGIEEEQIDSAAGMEEGRRVAAQELRGRFWDSIQTWAGGFRSPNPNQYGIALNARINGALSIAVALHEAGVPVIVVREDRDSENEGLARKMVDAISGFLAPIPVHEIKKGEIVTVLALHNQPGMVWLPYLDSEIWAMNNIIEDLKNKKLIPNQKAVLPLLRSGLEESRHLQEFEQYL